MFKFGRIGLLVIVLFVVGCMSGQSSQSRPVEPPSPSSLIGVYVGYGPDGVEYYKLDLRQNSIGYFATVCGPDTSLHSEGVHVYRIANWTLRGFKLGFELVPVKRDYELLRLHGAVSAFALSLEVGAKNEKWTQKLNLMKLERLAIPDKETSLAIEDASKQKNE